MQQSSLPEAGRDRAPGSRLGGRGDHFPARLHKRDRDADTLRAEVRRPTGSCPGTPHDLWRRDCGSKSARAGGVRRCFAAFGYPILSTLPHLLTITATQASTQGGHTLRIEAAVGHHWQIERNNVVDTLYSQYSRVQKRLLHRSKTSQREVLPARPLELGGLYSRGGGAYQRVGRDLHVGGGGYPLRTPDIVL